MTIDLAVVARDLKLPPEKVERTVQLLDEGNTIPFITRFRKDQTGGLGEEQILAVKQRVASLRSLSERKLFVIKSIESQSRLTEELKVEIDKATTSRRLEDLYHPFKAKKQSRAQTARHQGLEPLADSIFSSTTGEGDMSEQATSYVRVDKGLASVDDVIKGVGDLLAERFAENASLRSKLRKILWDSGSLVSKQILPNENQNPPKKKTEGDAAKAENKKPADAKTASEEKPMVVKENETAKTAPAGSYCSQQPQTRKLKLHLLHPNNRLPNRLLLSHQSLNQRCPMMGLQHRRPILRRQMQKMMTRHQLKPSTK